MLPTRWGTKLLLSMMLQDGVAFERACSVNLLDLLSAPAASSLGTHGEASVQSSPGANSSMLYMARGTAETTTV